MNYERLFADFHGKVVRAGLIGVGQFGATLIAQAQNIPMLSVPAVCDRATDRAEAACRAAGIDNVRICESVGDAEGALEDGATVVLRDYDHLVDLPLDVIVEATGNPEAAAGSGTAAIDAGKHLVIASKEAESVVGPLLSHRAREAGLVSTLVEGDQPSLLVGLYSWARLLGLDVICAGKSSEYDFVFDPENGSLTWQDTRIDASALRDHWTLPDEAVAPTLQARADILSAIPQRTVPDLCEMGVVANAIGLRPDTPAFHVPVARAVEVPDVFRPRTAGGILSNGGVIDVFNCLRRPDEQSFAGGVFVVVRCDSAETWEVLRGKGIPVSRSGSHAMLYNPSHLLGVEAPISILSAALLGQPTGGAAPTPVVDLVARTNRDWRAGETLAITDHHHHEVAGLDPLLIDAAPVAAGNPLPYYMATGRALTQDVATGTVLTADMVAAETRSALWRLRAEQDRLFHG